MLQCMRAKEREHYELYTHKHFIKGKPKLIMIIVQHLKGNNVPSNEEYRFLL